MEGTETSKIVEWLTISGMIEVDWTYDELHSDGNERIDLYILTLYFIPSNFKILFKKINCHYESYRVDY